MYIDTSVAVKLFTREPDSDACESTVGGFTLVSSELTYCELRSALRSKKRDGLIPAETMTAAWALFERYLEERRIHLMALNWDIVQEATAVLGKLPAPLILRTLDALHLATFARIAVGPFFTKDKRLRAAAQHLKLPLAE